MSESRVKIEELLKRAEALEEKIDTTLKKHKKVNSRKKSENNSKLSLKKKRTVKYFESKTCEPAKAAHLVPKKIKLFNSIQFSSSDEDQMDEAAKVSSNSDVASSELIWPNLSVAYSAVHHSSSADFVPDSCPNQDGQSMCHTIPSSRNVSELVCDVDVSNVRDSFSSGDSERIPGGDANSSPSASAVVPAKNDGTSSNREKRFPVRPDQHRESNSNYNSKSSSSQLPNSNLEDSIFVLSNRLERTLSSKVKNMKTDQLSHNQSNDVLHATFSTSVSSSSSVINDCKLEMKMKKTGKGKTSGEKMKLIKAMCFSSDEEVVDSPDRKTSNECQLLNRSVPDKRNGMNVSGASSIGDTSSQLQIAPDEIISLADRLNRILLAPSTKRKMQKKNDRQNSQRTKMIMMPDLFNSSSDDSSEDGIDGKNAATDNNSELSSLQTIQESSTDAVRSGLESLEKKNLSLQVSLSSFSEQEYCYNAPTESYAGKEQGKVSSGCDVTEKSLQCSFGSESDSSLEGKQEITCSDMSLTSKSLQVSLSSDAPCSPCGERLVSSVNKSLDDGVNGECNSLVQPAMCDISLQISILSPEAPDDSPDLGKETNSGLCDGSRNGGRQVSRAGDDADFNECIDILYKTAIDGDTSNHLYKTVLEYAPLSPVCSLFVDPVQNAESAADLKKHSNHGSMNDTEDLNGLQDSTSTSRKNIHKRVYILSSSESEEDNCCPIKSGSEDELDVNQPDCAQSTSGKRLWIRGRPASNKVNTFDSIYPDQKYEDGDSSDDIIVSRSHCESADSSSEDEMESFFQKMKKPEKPKKAQELGDFIVADDELSSEDEEDILFYHQINQALSPATQKHKPKSTASCNRDQSTSSVDSPEMTDDETDDKENTPLVRPAKPPSLTCRPKPKRAVLSHLGIIATPMRQLEQRTPDITKRKSFLSSLSFDCNDCQRDLDAMKYIKNFKKHKEELSCKLFKIYNDSVFSSKLPADLPIIWNTRMYKTAGYCTYKKNKFGIRTTKVELSVKVCDSAERLRDTLLHELCHATVWLLHGKLDGHGLLWKHWACKANLIYPELPIISRCHSYKIKTKYTYKCTKCGYQIGRHSKSLDTASKVCGYCMSPFELICNSGNRQQTPNRFAQFVKSSYGSLKKQGQLSHQETMRKLAADFASKNKVDK